MDIEQLYQTFKKRLMEDLCLKGWSWDGVVSGELVERRAPGSFCEKTVGFHPKGEPS